MNLKNGYEEHLNALLKVPNDPINHQFNYSAEDFLKDWVEFSGDEVSEIERECRHRKANRSSGQKLKNQFLDNLTQEKFEANPYKISIELVGLYFYGYCSHNESFLRGNFSFGRLVFDLREIMELIKATNNFYKNIQNMKNYDSFSDFFQKKKTLGKVEFILRAIA